MIHAIRIKFTAVNYRVLNTYSLFLKKILNKLSISFGYIHLPTKTKRLTVLKSPHVHKKAREQFEIKTYNRLLVIPKKITKKHLLFLFTNKPKFITLSLKK